MPFIVPSDIKKVLTDNTIKNYKAKLNILSKNLNINTVQELIDNSETVINFINEYIPGDESKDRYKKRVFYSAIFYVLDNYHLSVKQSYYDEFQKAKEYYKNPLSQYWIGKEEKEQSN